MRASRLLQILLILQNRGRLTASQLAAELEVDRRTVLRDVDALSEAGLPIITFQGQGGGIELGFDYRTRLTGLDPDEAEAMALILSLLPPELTDLDLAVAGTRAQAKLREAFPDQTRRRMTATLAQFPVPHTPRPAADSRRAALAMAIRHGHILRLRAKSATPVIVHPVALELRAAGWVLLCASGARHSEADWGDVNISARRFDLDKP